MGNLLSVLIGCVGAVELITLLHQITARAELEYERLRLSEGDSTEILQRIISEQSVQESVTTVVPQIHFGEYERSQSVPENPPPVVDGLKYRPLVRDDGTGRRRAFKKRNSSDSIDSKISREEELRMFTSLEEEEFKSMTQGDYVPISYAEPGLKVRKHNKRHRKSPISDSYHESTGTLSSSEITEGTLSEETEDEMTYPWGDINPEHHKGFKHQMEKSLSIGELHEEDEKLGSSVESGTDWRKNAEIAKKSAEKDSSADLTVSSGEWKNPGDFEAPPSGFACVDEQIPELEDEAKVEEWLNHGRLRDSFSPSSTLTRSKRCLQMDSMDVQDGDTSDTTELTADDIVIVEASLLNHSESEDTYSYLDFTAEEKEEILMGLQEKSPSPIVASRVFLEQEREDEVSGEEEIEDFDDIVNALKKNVAKEEIEFEDLLEDTPTSQKSDIFSVSPEKEPGENAKNNEGETFKFPGKIFAAYNEFPTEDTMPLSDSAGDKSRCEILEHIKRENRKRQRNDGPDRYYAPRPSVIDFPTKLELSNAALEEKLKVFPVKNINDSQFFPSIIIPVREESKTSPEIIITELPSKSDDDLVKFINMERLSISRQQSPGRQSNMRIADRDDPIMDLLKDRMFPY